MLTFCDLHS